MTAARPRRILVVGGTHGNERGGILVVDNFRRNPSRFAREGLEIDSLLANPEAARRNVRYLDVDLNRCFGPALAEARPDHPLRERRLAHALRERIRPGGIAACDLLVDLHNTTGAMGASWILTNDDPWAWWLAARARERRPDLVRVLHTPETLESNVFLPSLGPLEITLEIGPAPHGVVSHEAWEVVETQLLDLLDDLASVDAAFDPRAALAKLDFPYFLGGSDVSFPLQGEDGPASVVHRDRLGRDYLPMERGEPAFFVPSTGETIPWDGETCWPVFVGEAAYVEKGVAFVPTQRRSFQGGQGVLP